MRRIDPTTIARDVRECPIAWFSVKRRPFQRAFFYDDAVVSVILGGRRAGKTTCVVARVVAAATGIEPIEMPGCNEGMPKPPLAIRHFCVDIARTWEQVILPKYLALIPPSMLDKRKGARKDGYERHKYTLWLKNGTYIQPMTYGMTLEKSESAAIDLIPFDEIPRQELFHSQLNRILTSGGRIFIAGCLDQRAPTWPIDWVHEDLLSGENPYVSVHVFKTEDNLKALADEVGEELGGRIMKNLDAMRHFLSQEEQDIVLNGTPSWKFGRVYKEFKPEKHAVDGFQPYHFAALAKKGYGEIYAGWDHGINHPTCIAYGFVTLHDVPDLPFRRGDIIVFDEYWRRGIKAPQMLEGILELHKLYMPRRYFCCRRMFVSGDIGPSVARYYQEHGIRPLISVSTGRMDAIDPGVQLVTTMLTEGDEWPRLRVLKRCTNVIKAFKGWSFKPSASETSMSAKYSDKYKDAADAVRYLVMGCARLSEAPMITAPPLAMHPRLPIPLVNMLSGVGY